MPAWCQPYAALVNPQFHMCTSLTPRPMTVVFGLGTRLRVRMRTTFENGILRNGQQPGNAVNSFINLGKFVVMKTLSGGRAPWCDKHQFHDKMTVSTWTVFELLLFEQMVIMKKEEEKRRNEKNLPHTFAFSCLPGGFWALIWVLLITKKLKEEG